MGYDRGHDSDSDCDDLAVAGMSSVIDHRLLMAIVAASILMCGCDVEREPNEAEVHQWAVTKISSSMGDADTFVLSVKSPDPSHILSPRVFPRLSIQCGGSDADVWLKPEYPSEPELGRDHQVTIRYRLDSGAPVSLIGDVGKDLVAIRLGGGEFIGKLLAYKSMRVEYTPFRSDGHPLDFAFDLNDMDRALTSSCPEAKIKLLHRAGGHK